ncbi:MAG TPA: hypothetical protein VLL08_14560, partial [Kineosporiaceae bacterium]|nr:hypothetical protein [Kineosporiaceae bacterium]
RSVRPPDPTAFSDVVQRQLPVVGSLLPVAQNRVTIVPTFGSEPDQPSTAPSSSGTTGPLIGAAESGAAPSTGSGSGWSVTSNVQRTDDSVRPVGPVSSPAQTDPVVQTYPVTPNDSAPSLTEAENHPLLGSAPPAGAGAAVSPIVSRALEVGSAPGVTRRLGLGAPMSDPAGAAPHFGAAVQRETVSEPATVSRLTGDSPLPGLLAQSLSGEQSSSAEHSAAAGGQEFATTRGPSASPGYESSAEYTLPEFHNEPVAEVSSPLLGGRSDLTAGRAEDWGTSVRDSRTEHTHSPSPSVQTLTMPSAPAMPSAPSLPEMPMSAPAAPSAPTAPTMPEMPTMPSAPSIREISVPAPGSAAAQPGAGAPTPAGPAMPSTDELVRTLFDPLAARLKAELRLDRERAGVVTDLRR